MSRLLKVALVQEFNQGDAEHNLARIEQRVAEAAAGGAKLVLLQELHNGPYFCQHQSVDEFDRAEAIPGPSTERLSRLAKQHGVVLVASLFERRAPGLAHNTSFLHELCRSPRFRRGDTPTSFIPEEYPDGFKVPL